MYIILELEKPTSVLDLINKFQEANNITIPYVFKDRRDGDIDILYCDSSKTINELEWEAKLTIADICKDSYNFIKNN